MMGASQNGVDAWVRANCTAVKDVPMGSMIPGVPDFLGMSPGLYDCRAA
jgi:hypothetical protein